MKIILYRHKTPFSWFVIVDIFTHDCCRRKMSTNDGIIRITFKYLFKKSRVLSNVVKQFLGTCKNV